MSRKVAICFFGITRSLNYTHTSIEANVLAPARKLSSPKVYAHFFLQKEIDNPRTGEKGQLDHEQHRLLPIDWLKLEDPDRCLGQWNFEGLKAWGDSWGDDFRSMRNLIHQLHSLYVVTEAALADGAEVCLVCRPDLLYHDSLDPVLARALRTKGDCVFLPFWQGYRGLNDRFAICVGPKAIAAYGQRILMAEAYCRERGVALHSERLLAFSLKKVGVRVQLIGARATRVRMNAAQFEEDFSKHRIRDILYPRLAALSPWLAALPDRPGMGQSIRNLLRRGGL